jgi:hypothetical protein
MVLVNVYRHHIAFVVIHMKTCRTTKGGEQFFEAL